MEDILKCDQIFFHQREERDTRPKEGFKKSVVLKYELCQKLDGQS